MVVAYTDEMYEFNVPKYYDFACENNPNLPDKTCKASSASDGCDDLAKNKSKEMKEKKEKKKERKDTKAAKKRRNSITYSPRIHGLDDSMYEKCEFISPPVSTDQLTYALQGMRFEDWLYARDSCGSDSFTNVIDLTLKEPKAKESVLQRIRRFCCLCLC
ncbi:hypothetical protein QR680_001320 [Steinernema hermaphroditum]|uniref:Uncharacterized protein n=1 Tax=Steinernema hermaphroditum TaxID=289476 RepID=A0AA39H0J7_9BILA|nr:hypothetical protein QR680_001320 [Steinernema hermaphroditum]